MTFIITESILSLRTRGWMADEPDLIEADEAASFCGPANGAKLLETTPTSLTFGWERNIPGYYLRKAHLEGTDADITDLRVRLGH